MRSDPVVVVHQVLANVSLSLLAGRVASSWYQFCFQTAKHPLRQRIDTISGFLGGGC